MVCEKERSYEFMKIRRTIYNEFFENSSVDLEYYI